MRKQALFAAIAAGIAIASPAAAATVVTACPAAFSASPDLVKCVYTDKNALGGSADKLTEQQDALKSLLGVSSYPIIWSGPSGVEQTKALFSYADDPSPSSTVDGILTYAQPLFGQTVIGIHVGGGNPSLQNKTAFLLFDFMAPTTVIKLTQGKAFSDAVLYQTGAPPAVPEPATWAMLILGFGAVGGAMRAARKRRTTLAFV